MNRKKIVHIVPSFGPGGVQTAMLYSMNDVNETFDYKILILTEVHEYWIKELNEKERSFLIKCNSKNLLSGYIKGYRYLKKNNPDVVICSLWKSILLAFIFKIFNQKKIVFSFFHTSYSPHFTYIFLHKLLVKFQNASLADSNATRDYVKKFYQVKNIYVIPFLFKFDSSMRHKPLSLGTVKFVYFGNLLGYKNIDRTLDFCKLCKENKIDFKFDIYTFSPPENCKSKIALLGLSEEISIHKAISLNKVKLKMSEYDFLLQLSNEEGMALSVVEAMSYGLVPIVTPVGEIARYSIDGENAIWLNPKFDDNLLELCNKLKKVLADKIHYQKLSYNAQNVFVNYKRYDTALIEAVETELSKQI